MNTATATAPALLPDDTRRLQAALAAYQDGRYAEAASLCEEVLAGSPRRADGWTLLGMCQRRQDRPDLAAASYRRAIDLDPGYADTYNNLANIHRETGAFAEAVACYQSALSIRPDWAEVHSGLAATFQAMGRLPEALAHFQRALALAPDNPDIHWDYSLGLLLAGRYEEGWREYEWRWQRGQPPARGFAQPEWRGEPLAGRRLLVYGEQGYGDALQFLRFVPRLRDCGGPVILEVLEPLLPLVASSLPVDQLVAAGHPLPEFDCHIPLISLARIFGIGLAQLPGPMPYLRPDPARVAAWRPRLPANGLRVGLVWAGNPNVKNDHWRSPRLAPLLPLFAIPGVRFVALQRGAGRDDLAGLAVPDDLTDLGDQVRDFADTAAVLAQLDLLITTDTSVAHLAGALGCPTWLMLHAVPDWRWLLERRDSPWYPSLRLYRQKALGRWDDVVRSLAEDLAVLATKRRAGDSPAPAETLIRPPAGHNDEVKMDSSVSQPATGDVLRAFFERGQCRLIHKWMHFFEIYERHFAKFRGRPLNFLEFGVYHGGSLQMWKHYFGDQAKIYGVDIDPRCAALAEENVEILLGDQEDRQFLRSIKQSLPKFDIILDDGGHTMGQQIATFEEMFWHLNDGGIYLAEDLHTSYMPSYGGGYRNPGSFIEYSKRLIDQLNAWHSREAGFAVDAFTRSAYAMHYYDSVLVIEKRAMAEPVARMKGTPSFPLSPVEAAVYSKG